MNTIKLSICIATYNRAQYIGETLQSIIPQLTDATEVIIADGASTDNTQDVVAEYAKSCPQIRYFRLPQKGGVDQDYCKAVDLARGEFCWLFTDDDILKQSAIATVLGLLGDKVLDLVVVNAEVRDTRLAHVLESRRVPAVKDIVFGTNELGSLLALAGNYLSFIGCVIIRKSCWDSREKECYFGSEFIHVGVIFQAPFTQDAYFLADPQVVIRYGNAQWTSRGFEIWMFKWPKLIWSFDFDAKSKYQVTKYPDPWRRFTPILAARAMNSYSIELFNRWVRPNLGFGIRRVLLQAIAVLPISTAMRLRDAGRRLAGLKRDTLTAYTYAEYVSKGKKS